MQSGKKSLSLIGTALFLLAALLSSVTSASAQYGPAVKIASLQDNRITESSGLATSRRYPDPLTGILWTHNDSGNPPYLFATNRQGETIACYQVAGATNIDWEDLAEGPGRGGVPSLYIADIGDNNRVRNDLGIYRVTEPDAFQSLPYPAITRIKANAWFPFRYPDGAHYDAETLLIHPKTGDAFIVTKDSGGASRVFQFPMPLTKLTSGVEVVLTQVAALTFSSILSYGRMATGGDIAPDGSKLAIRTYTLVYEWPISPGQTVAQALTSNPRKSYGVPLAQGESLAYRPDGLALLFTHEGAPCPLYELPPIAGRYYK